VKHNAGIATVVIHYGGMTIRSLLAAIHKKLGLVKANSCLLHTLIMATKASSGSSKAALWM
jgi:hypothetical protein